MHSSKVSHGQTVVGKDIIEESLIIMLVIPAVAGLYTETIT